MRPNGVRAASVRRVVNASRGRFSVAACTRAALDGRGFQQKLCVFGPVFVYHTAMDPRIERILPWTKKPHMDGYIHPAFDRVAQLLREQLSATPGGAAVCIYHRGECVVDLWGGARDAEGRAWQADTMSPSFSTTKGIASTLLHIMVDRELLDYDAPVSRYWPEFAQAGKERVTVRHVLAHQSGLYHIRQMVDRAQRMVDWDYMIQAIEQTEPVHPPGERTGYHGLTYGYLVGEILQRVTGKPFRQLVQEELVDPLELDGMYIGAPSEELYRAADLIWPSPSRLQPYLPRGFTRGLLGFSAPALNQGARLFGLELDVQSILDSLAPRGISSFDFGANATLRASIPAANGLFTARSLARVYAALAGGGELDGVQLLSRKTLRRAMRRQRRGSKLAVIPFDMRWRLGYHGVFTTQGSPRNAFGHFGFGGSGAWADPSRNLSVAMVVNAGLGTPFGDLRIARISAAALSAVDARPTTSRSGVPKPKRSSSSAKGRRAGEKSRGRTPRPRNIPAAKPA
ncbi:MAG: serine hydrolase [Myxococcota bacterium]|nr:serine hydrolase [Myxococcota bacterium]